MAAAALLLLGAPALGLLAAAPPRAVFAGSVPRTAPVVMGAMTAPPAPPAVHSGRGYGGGDGDGLLLCDVDHEERQALLSLWKFQYEAEEDQHDERDVRAVRFMSRWVGDVAPSGWFGMFKGRTIGVYFGDVERVEGLVAVRYERDNSDWLRILCCKHTLIVDEMVLSPAIPDRLRGAMHAAIMQAILSLGAFHQMSVLFWEDFDI